MDGKEITKLVFEGVGILVVSVFGVFGNGLSILILQSPHLDMKVMFKQILFMLTVFDTVFVVCMLISFSFPELIQGWREEIHPNIFPKFLPFIQICLNGSSWSTVAITIERSLSVTCHHRKRFFKTSVYYILPVVIGSFLWNTTRFMELNTCYKLRENSTQLCNIEDNIPMTDFIASNGTFLYANITDEGTTSTNEDNEHQIESPCYLAICPTEMRKDMSYCRDYVLIANFLVMVLTPFIILATLNYKLYRYISDTQKALQLMTQSSKSQRREIKVARILIVIVSVFCICNIPRVIINIYEVCHLVFYGNMFAPWPMWCDMLTYFSHFLLVISSSTNFLIYCWKDRKFRRLLLLKLGLQGKNKVIDWENFSMTSFRGSLKARNIAAQRRGTERQLSKDTDICDIEVMSAL